MRVQHALGEATAVGKALPERYDALWLDLGEEDRPHIEQWMRRLYRAHPVAVARILDGRHRPRQTLLVEPDAVVFILTHIDPVAPLPAARVYPVGVALGQRFLVTVRHRDSVPWLDRAWEAVERHRWLAHGVDFALYHLLSAHLQHLQGMDEAINREFERVQETLLKRPYLNLAPDIVALRRWVMWARRLSEPELEIFTLLGSDTFRFVSDGHRPYFQDLKAQMQDIADDVQNNREGLSGTVEAYTSMQSNEINKVMKFLTILSVLALPATTIASVYGMNFYIPETHWPFGYAYSLALMGAVTGVLLWLMRRRDWFR